MEFEKLIIDKGFDPVSFHKILGLDRQVVSNYRKGLNKPNKGNLLRIASALDMTVDEVAECFYTDLKDVGNLEKLRILNGLTQKEVAEKLDVSESTVSLYESGKRNPNIIILKKYAELFGCTIDELVC